MSAAELRERRRAKILMGSDERMKKVMEALLKSDKTTKYEARGSELNQLTVSSCTTGQQNGVKECTDHFSTYQATDCLEKLISSSGGNGDDITHNNPEENNIPVMDDVGTMLAAEAEVDDADTQASQRADGPTAAASVNLLRTFIWLLGGIVVRLVITSSFSAYIQTLVYPFVAIEISIYGIQHTLGIDVTGSGMLKSGLWISLLHLAGIDQNLIETYGLIMGHIYSTLNDFAIYLFAFVMTHVVL